MILQHRPLLLRVSEWRPFFSRTSLGSRKRRFRRSIDSDALGDVDDDADARRGAVVEVIKGGVYAGRYC